METEVDHIVPLCSGGADSPENMQLLTKRQHREKNTRGFAAVPENEEKGNGGSPLGSAVKSKSML